MKTPLQITYEVVLHRQSPPDPVSIRKGLQKAMIMTRNQRIKQVVEYLMSNDETSARSDKGYGSLNFILYWLRDNVSELYEVSARVAIESAMRGDWPLSNAIHFLAQTNMVGEYIPSMNTSKKQEEFADRLAWVNHQGLRIAVNCSRRNLTNLAMRNGADIYIGASEEGGVIKARSGIRLNPVLTESLGENWAQPYPDLIVTKEPQDDPSIILDALNDNMVVQEREHNGLQRYDLKRNAQGYQPGRSIRY